MSKSLLSQTIKAVLPLVLGFLGGVTSTLFPAYFTAFCAGSL